MDTFQSPTGLVDQSRGLIRKVDGEVEAPKHIIRTPAAARAIYSMVRNQGLKRQALWAAIEGLIGGNPPYDQDDLDKHGLQFMTNYNDLSAMSRADKENLGYFNLLHQSEILVKIHIEEVLGEEGANADAGKWSKIMSAEFDRMLKSWKSWPTMMGTHSSQLSKFGLSVLLWPDERDWRPRTTELHRFHVPDKTSSDLDQLTFCFFENDFTAQYLFQVYEEITKGLSKEQKEDPNYHEKFWNPYALEQILLFRANTVVKPNSTPFLTVFDIQTAIQDGDYTFNQIFGDGIRLVTMLQKEYNGKVTHYMFDYTWQANSAFAFMAPDQYHDMSQACAIMTISPAAFTLYGNRGIGHKVFAPCQAKNQLACGMVDMARFSSTPMLRNNAGSVKDPQQIKMFPGVPTDIGAAEFVQNNLGSNIQQVVGALQYLEQNLNVNLGMSSDDAAIVDQSNASVSPTQARLQSYREFSILKDRVAHFYGQMDHVYANMLATVLRSKKGYPGYEYAAKFIRRCKAKGVPDEIFEVGDTEWGLPDHLTIKASRVAGDGSTVGLLLGLQEMLPIIGDLSPKAANEYKRDVVMAALGPDSIDRYMQDSDSPDEASGGASTAGTENAIMQQGFSPIFSPSNEHKSHFAVHMALATQLMQQVQQQQLGEQGPIEAQKVYDHLIPHLGEHWQFIAKSPFAQEFVKRYKKAYDQVVEYATLNRKNAIKMYEANIKKQQEEQAQTQQAMSEEQIKQFQAENDERRKQDESVAKIARQDQESARRAQLKEKELNDKAEAKRLELALDHGVQLTKAQNENTLEQNKAALERLTKVEIPNNDAR